MQFSYFMSYNQFGFISKNARKVRRKWINVVRGGGRKRADERNVLRIKTRTIHTQAHRHI